MKRFHFDSQNEEYSLSCWPLRKLTLVTTRLELRLPTEGELHELAALASTEDYDPAVPPLAGRHDTPAERGRRTLQHHWHSWGTWTPERWSLDLAMFEQGRPVGIQNVRAADFARHGAIETRMWTHHSRRGTGLCTLAHTMVLHFAFEGLRTTQALAETRKDNTPAQLVLRKFGYRTHGADHADEQDRAVVWQGLRLTTEQWHANRPTTNVSMRGVDECLPVFGLAPQHRPKG
ncbi:RimJ/RimL family protein N-acetyltransferase [Saccharopolyspora lacisalsi]|uniref:RimJ/RimL family protein N-acetyltransferase n=1 Tax=Halosaccharopolyspora lacisalsi TaxID=1000566 RepID=A0A839DWJ3_9PSEU|nr:GNAT family N-acetyltransferase [Halosaccharopolyspora lacisalsi]MBA8825129.1 RimJ/RimL family protein N-acetyltransferase [Halosaccharopolyspora lacisalsi]